MEELGIKTPWGTVEPLQSNEIPACLKCGVAITPENDSKWQLVTKEDDRIFQSVCMECWSEKHGS